MQKMKPLAILFNAGGALVFFIFAAYTGRSLFYTETIESCSARYSHLEQFPLKDENGGLLSDVQLQALIGYSDGMRLDGVKVMAVKDRPDVAAFDVSLPEGSSSRYQTETEVGGMAFQWNPIGMDKARSACLKYSVYLPEDFDFGDGGMLPGLYGGDVLPFTNARMASKEYGGRSGVAARVLWTSNGGGVFGQSQVARDKDADETVGGWSSMKHVWKHYTLPLGQWVTIEQEVVLNTPGKADGLVRLWTDGKMRVNVENISWRTDENMSLMGVIADVAYGNPGFGAGAPMTTSVRLTPFEISWE